MTPVCTDKNISTDARQWFYLFGVYILLMTVPDIAYAQPNSIQTTICKLIILFNGQTGKNIATLAVMIVGIGALMGKVSAGLCFIVCVGIALIFGSKDIVRILVFPNDRFATFCAEPTIAELQQSTELGKLICNVIIMLKSQIAKAFMTLAVISMGIGALMGKISWQLALTVTLGIALFFSAIAVVEALSPDAIAWRGCIDLRNVNLNVLAPPPNNR